MNSIIRFGLCILVNLLGVAEGLLIVFHVLVTGIKCLLEKGARVLIVFLVLFGIMFLIAIRFDNGDMFSRTWQNYITFMVVVVLVCAVLLIRSIGETLLLLLAGVVGLFAPTQLISRINMVTEKLADKYVSLAGKRISSNKRLFAVHTILYRMAQIVRIPLNILCFIAPVATSAIVGYSIGFVWSGPPENLTADWFFCVGLVVLCTCVGAYIGFNFVDTLKMYYVSEVDENEDS